MANKLSADLRFEVSVPDGATTGGHLFGSDNNLTLEVDDPSLFAGSGDAPAIRGIARMLAANRVKIRVMHRGQHLVSIGNVNAPWWQRRLTGSRRIKLGSLRGAWTSAKARAKGVEPILPDPEGMGGAQTLWPLIPTMGRRVRGNFARTHDPARGGGPRLVLVRSDVWGGERQPVFWLGDDTLIGSDSECQLTLPGLAARHARITHDERDEFVVEPLDGDVGINGASLDNAILRTGARVEIGPHVLVFSREEFADHGRPHGGRVGGELGRQRPQGTAE